MGRARRAGELHEHTKHKGKPGEGEGLALLKSAQGVDRVATSPSGLPARSPQPHPLI
jgi:hypothetical protein